MRPSAAACTTSTPTLHPSFNDYEDRRTRVIPVIMLQREAPSPPPDARLRGWPTTRSWSGRPPPSELADVGERCTRPTGAAWDEAAERYEGWFDEAVALIRSGGTNLFGVETELIGDLHGRCRRAIHLQCAAGRDTLSLWNHGADEVVGVDFSPRMLELAARLTRGDRRAGALDPGRRARDAARARRHAPTSCTPAAGRSSGSPTSMPGRPSSPGCCRPTGGSSCSRAIRPSGCSTPTPTAAGSRTDYDYFGGAEASTGWAPEYIDRLSIADPTRAGSSPAPGRSARSSPRCSGADLRLEEVAEHPVDWWGGHADVAPRSAAGSRCRSRWSAAREPELRRGSSPANRPSGTRRTRSIATIAVRPIGP